MTGVDENTSILVKYKNDFHSKLKVAINQNIGCEAIIEGTNGKIIVPNLVKPDLNYKIIVKKNTYKELSFSGKNLYSYIASDVERYLLNNLKEPDEYGLKLPEIRNNLYLLDMWKK